MKLSEFIVLNEAEKKRAVMNDAVALATWTAPGLVIFLFQIEDYYVEAYCNATDKSIGEYRVLPNTNALQHYLDFIPIDDLLN
jgi:hypothetical protein